MKETPFLENRPEIISRFRSIPFFSTFSEPDLNLLVHSSKICVYNAGESIIEEGKNDQWMYILLSGQVSVTKGRAQISILSDFGSLFGELTALSHLYRSASVTALTPTNCIAIELQIFNSQTEPDKSAFYAVIYRLLATNICERLLMANELISRQRVEIDILKDQLLGKN